MKTLKIKVIITLFSDFLFTQKQRGALVVRISNKLLNRKLPSSDFAASRLKICF